MTTSPAELRADCSRCFALCCVAPAFTRSTDFAIDKPAGQPCPNLLADFRCSIHDQLRGRGFAGCTVFDCFGAGQKVAQQTFDGQDWRRHPDLAPRMFAAFRIMRDLHELLWYLNESLARQDDAELRLAFERTEALTRLGPDELAEVDVGALRGEINPLLVRVSEAVREAERGPELRGADLVGKDLRRRALRGASLRGARLIGADLRGVDLGLADLTGADVRGADVRGARLADCLFLTQAQLDAAIGDRDTSVPASLTPPAHWQST